jgi:hypothetical protein
MPRIENLPEELYGPNTPYHHTTDNLPLENLLRRQNLINSALDNLVEQQRDAIGTQGTLANRLNQSLNEDGSLRVAAVDDLEHSIEAHTDTDTYVRMLKAESDKLSLIADEATNFAFSVQEEEDGDIVLFDSGVLRLVPSSSITPEIVDSTKVRLNLAFPLEAAHRHYYDGTPVPVTVDDPDYVNYKVNSSATPFVEGSLRVYVNGVRLSATAELYVPGALVTDPWTLMTYTPDHEAGTFAFSLALNEEDIIRIDYDISFV